MITGVIGMYEEIMEKGKTVISDDSRAVVELGDIKYIVDTKEEDVLRWKRGTIPFNIANEDNIHPTDIGFGDVLKRLFDIGIAESKDGLGGLDIEYRLEDERMEVRVGLDDTDQGTSNSSSSRTKLSFVLEFENLRQFEDEETHKKRIVSEEIVL